MVLGHSPWLSVFSLFAVLYSSVVAYEVPVSDKDYDRQICTGMWANQKTYINGRPLKERAHRIALNVFQLHSTVILRASWQWPSMNGATCSISAKSPLP